MQQLARRLGVVVVLELIILCGPALALERFEDEDVRIDRPDADLVLAGTLSLPSGEGPHPAVLMLTGSGGHTRDQVISGLPMFRVIGDDLARRGVAVLRVDDRGTGESTGPGVRASTTADRMDDALACFRYLESRPEIDPDRIGLLGHSEGTATAAGLAAAHPEVGFLVLLSPFAITGAELWAWQQGTVVRNEGELDEQKIQAIETALLGLVRHIGMEGNTDEGFQEHGRQACLAWGDPPEMITEAFVDDAFGDLRQPWYEYFFATNPRGSLEQVRQPLIALFGSADEQTPAQLNLGPLVDALLTAGNEAFTVTVLPDEDHFFMKAEGLAPNEHVHGQMQFSREALRTIGDWLAREVVGR